MPRAPRQIREGGGEDRGRGEGPTATRERRSLACRRGDGGRRRRALPRRGRRRRAPTMAKGRRRRWPPHPPRSRVRAGAPGERRREGRDGGDAGRLPAPGEPPEAEERSRRGPARRPQTKGDRTVWRGGDRRRREKERGRRGCRRRRATAAAAGGSGGAGTSAGASESPPSCLRETTREPSASLLFLRS
jgi:hypothetical protein